MSGGWIGDPRSEPCEMGGGKLIDYPRIVREPCRCGALFDSKLELIASELERGALNKLSAQSLATRVRRMKVGR